MQCIQPLCTIMSALLKTWTLKLRSANAESFSVAAPVIWTGSSGPFALVVHLPRTVPAWIKNPPLPAGLQALRTLFWRVYRTELTWALLTVNQGQFGCLRFISVSDFMSFLLGAVGLTVSAVKWLKDVSLKWPTKMSQVGHRCESQFTTQCCPAYSINSQRQRMCEIDSRNPTKLTEHTKQCGCQCRFRALTKLSIIGRPHPLHFGAKCSK